MIFQNGRPEDGGLSFPSFSQDWDYLPVPTIILCSRLFGNSGACSACGQSIPASELVMRAQGNVYHLKVVFVCLFKTPYCSYFSSVPVVASSHRQWKLWLIRCWAALVAQAQKCRVPLSTQVCLLLHSFRLPRVLCWAIFWDCVKEGKTPKPMWWHGVVLDRCSLKDCLWGCACFQWVSLPLQCFTCSTCRNRLVPGDRFHYINGSLFCEHDRPTALINGHLNSLQSNPLLPDQKVNTQQFLISILRTGWRAEPSERRVSLACSSFTSSSHVRSVQRCSSKLPLNLLIKHHRRFWVGSVSVTSAMLNIGDRSPRRDKMGH